MKQFPLPTEASIRSVSKLFDPEPELLFAEAPTGTLSLPRSRRVYNSPPSTPTQKEEPWEVLGPVKSSRLGYPDWGLKEER